MVVGFLVLFLLVALVVWKRPRRQWRIRTRAETLRRPTLHWPYHEDTKVIRVELKRGFHAVPLTDLRPSDPDFEDALFKAVAEGRERAMALQTAEKSSSRRLPR